MRISRIRIQNFRNFSGLDVNLGEHAVIVGENKIGKSNLLHALRLVLDPSLPDSARKLREEDFWDGLARPLGNDDRITISVDIADFESNENQLAVLAEHLVKPDPMIARLTYVWQPLPGLADGPRKDSDYEFIVYGGDRPENAIGYQVRQRLPLELMPALRDCEGDLARWTRSPLRPLLDKAAGLIDREELTSLAEKVDEATGDIAALDEVSAVAEAIKTKLSEMVGSAQALETMLRFSETDPDKLIRALRIFIDGGRRGISDASLGSANLLYLALKTLEYDQLTQDGDRDHTFLAIEEPEAHLHPNLQRLVFRNYLRGRHDTEGKDLSRPYTILMTTHSPHIASVAPLKDLVLIRASTDGDATEAVSTAGLNLPSEDVADLERYLDVNRGELLFARGVILVEGDAEKFLIPVLAKSQGCDLDELGISVCSISGTHFWPYLMLIGPQGLNLPLAVVTDNDPLPKDEDGTPKPLSYNRVVHMSRALVGDDVVKADGPDETVAKAPAHGIFVGIHTLEIDLFRAGLHSELSTAMSQLSSSAKRRKRMSDWAAKPGDLDPERLIEDIEAIGKGRFAQRLANIVAKTGTNACPEYISKGIKYVAGRCKPD